MRPNRFKHGLRALGLLLAATGAGVAAQPTEPAERAPLPRWELGAFAFGVSQQAYPGSDQQVDRALLLPYGLYRGRFLRADRETAGLRAVRTPTFEIDVGVAGAFGSSASDIEARRGMADLGTLVEFGPRLKWNLGEGLGGRLRLELPVRGVFDIDDRLAHRGTSFEPEVNWRRRTDAWTWGASVGLVAADRRLADTFYGVPASVATPTRPAYRARGGLVAWRFGASATREITDDWRLFVFGRLDSVEGAANQASPLVRRTNGASVGVGVTYTWLRSSRPAED